MLRLLFNVTNARFQNYPDEQVEVVGLSVGCNSKTKVMTGGVLMIFSVTMASICPFPSVVETIRVRSAPRPPSLGRRRAPARASGQALFDDAWTGSPEHRELDGCDHNAHVRHDGRVLFYCFALSVSANRVGRHGLGR